ncbi:unnamed protein product [Penicillium salamii]|nr:unnamed protein product [Penicillium salamii]CAG8168599.1 unnamed protein product [Penicillium salamii]CAG8247655.1 unnamed protein product [Penicillium salamii]
MSTARGLRRIIRRFLDRKINIEDLEKIVGDSATTSLPVTGLSLKDVQKMFSLRQILDVEFDTVEPVQLPHDLKLYLQWTDEAHRENSGNEASIRLKLNLLLVRAHQLVTSSLPKSPRPINIQMEKTWAYRPVQWKGKTHAILGRPDYAIWYGEEEDTDLNVVIIEAKRPSSSSLGIPQALAYMACIHRQRKDLGKADTTVYSIATDIETFHLLKLDNEAWWSVKHVSVVDNNFEEVFGAIIHLMRKAASMSPTTSKRTSRRTQEGSGESDLIFDHNPERDVDSDDAMDEDQ